MEVNIEKKIASGAVGITYIGSIKNKKVVVKLAHILLNDIDKTIKDLREFDTFARNYPEHFMICKSIAIINECNYIQPIPEFIDDVNDKQHKWFKDLHSSQYCLQTIYNPILHETYMQWGGHIHKSLTSKKTTALYWNKYIAAANAQIYYADYLMRNNGWIHPDMHTGNIMYKNTSEKYSIAKINNKKIKIPTYGKQWYIIDYDQLYRKKEKLKNAYNNKSLFNIRLINENPHFWLAVLINQMLYQPWWGIIKKNKMKILSEAVLYKKILSQPETTHLINFIPKQIRMEEKTIRICIITICILLFPDVFFKIQKFNGQEWNIILDETKNYNNMIDHHDIIYYIQNLTNHKNVINRLIKTK